MRFHRVLADDQAFGHHAVAQPRRHRLEDLELPWRDAEFGHTIGISLERHCNRYLYFERHWHLVHHHGLARTREVESQPDPEGGEDERDDAAVDLERVLDDEKAVLHKLEHRDQHAAEDAVDQDSLLHASPWFMTSSAQWRETLARPFVSASTG